MDRFVAHFDLIKIAPLGPLGQLLNDSISLWLWHVESESVYQTVHYDVIELEQVAGD